MLKKVIYIGLVVLLALGLFIPLFIDVPWLTGLVSPPLALLMGLVFALIFGRVYPKVNKGLSKYLLQYSVVGLGFGMNFQDALASGREGMLFTIISVMGTLFLGWLLGRYIFKLDKNTTYLISSGTAICGGSAIAAVGPIIKAKEGEMSVALGTVFILNAIGLFLFPYIGRLLAMSQSDFGFWAAISIHDTSSVVGAGQAYGAEALDIATTIKLTRALWIAPLALITSLIFKNNNRKAHIPRFIIFFILAMLLNSYLLGDYPQFGMCVSKIARKFLTISLFFIGAGLTRDVLKSVGLKSLLLGVSLWVVISLSTLLFIILL